MFDLKSRIEAFNTLGKFILQYEEENHDDSLKKLNSYFLEPFRDTITEAGTYNNWFTKENVHFALDQWGHALSESSVDKWISGYTPDHFENDGEKVIATVMAGNIPLVGMHDMLSILISGHKLLVKPSSDDARLLPFLAQILVAIDRRFAERIQFADGKIQGFDAVIATGSNNSSRYFDYYFSKYPHIIRQNRTSIAVLDGSESDEDLDLLAQDVFQYFGLGCRNVSKLYLPEGYDLDNIFKAFFKYKDVIDNKKYGNNYDYNRALLMMEEQDFLENGFAILRKNEALQTPVSVTNYEYYSDLNKLQDELATAKDEIQCVVSHDGLVGESVGFGQSQKPELWDYADGVDTIKFLRAV